MTRIIMSHPFNVESFLERVGDTANRLIATDPIGAKPEVAFPFDAKSRISSDVLANAACEMSRTLNFNER